MVQGTAEHYKGIQNDAEFGLNPDLVYLMQTEIKQARNEDMPVAKAFKAISKKSGLKVNTVRNYYYRYLHNNKQDKTSGSTKAKGRNTFNDKEVEYLITEMLKSQAQGNSVRASALMLANGDEKTLLRYQNKYRNVVTKNKDYVNMIIKNLEKEGIAYYNPYTKKYSHISEIDLNNNNDSNFDKVEISLKDKDSNLLGYMADIVENIKQIEELQTIAFFKDLSILCKLALESERSNEYKSKISDMEQLLQRYKRQLKEKDVTIQETKGKMIVYHNQLERNKKVYDEQISKLNKLATINMDFLKLTDEDKLRNLNRYCNEVSQYVED